MLHLIVFLERRFERTQALGSFRMFGRKVFRPFGQQVLELVFFYVGHIDDFERILFIPLFDDAIVPPILFKRGIGFPEVLLVGHVGDTERDFYGHLRQLSAVLPIDSLEPNLLYLYFFGKIRRMVSKMVGYEAEKKEYSRRLLQFGTIFNKYKKALVYLISKMKKIRQKIRRMKRRNLLVTSLLAGLFCISGLQAQKASALPGTAAGYVQPAFTDPMRMEKIRKALPAVEKIFRDYTEKNHIPGTVFGVVVDDALIFSGQIGFINLESKEPVRNSALFRIASMTKSFTAMAIVKLRDEGKLSLYDPVSKYLPQLKKLELLSTDAPEPTLLNLLTMTAGFPEDNPWGDRQLEDSDAEFLEFLQGGIAFSTIPSSGYEYSNLGFAMLGRIISQVSGMPYQQYISEQIFKPLGMTQTFWEYEGLPAQLLALGYRWEDAQWKLEPMLHDGAYGAMGGLITSLDDFGKYMAFHLSAWPARSGPEKGPVKRSSLREMQQLLGARLVVDTREVAGRTCPAMVGYGYGLRVRRDCQGILQVGHSGGLPGFGSNHTFLPDYGIGVIAFSNRTYAPATAVCSEALQTLVREAALTPRQLPASAILETRKEQVLQLLKTWDPKLGNDFLAENFYLDSSREHRQQQAQAALDAIGPITGVEPIVPENQLRGTFRIRGEKGTLSVFFTLSPEYVPKVQALDIRIL